MQIIAAVKELIIESLGLEDIDVRDLTDDLPLFSDDGLGLDSVDALELGLALQRKFGLQMDNDTSALRQHFHSVATLAKYIEHHQQSNQLN